MLEKIFIAGIFIVPAVIILAGYFLMKRTAPESNAIKAVLDAEVARINKLTAEQAQEFCKKEPAVELLYNNTKFIRLITCDRYGASQVVIRVTVRGTLNKELEESKVITKELDN